MQLRMITLTCVLAVFSPMVWGQTAAPTTLPATLPSAGEAAVVAPPGSWVGLLNGNNVYVRSGPGEQAYVCSRISVPDKVTVVGKTGDWLKILPPTGCFSVVNKSYIQLDPTGKIGTMSGDNVFCRAAGDLRSSQFFAVQRRLRKGEQVQILGEVAEFYKIVPPSDVYFFISSRYVHPESGSIPPEFASAKAPAAARQPSLEVVPELPTASPTNKIVALPPSSGSVARISPSRWRVVPEFKTLVLNVVPDQRGFFAFAYPAYNSVHFFQIIQVIVFYRLFAEC